jgi:hypothetical protein
MNGKDSKKKPRLDERFSWSFLSVLIAVASTVFALYVYFHHDQPDLVFEIDGQSDVFDLHRPLADLQVLFRKQDIEEQNLNLRILTLRVWNRGRVNVLQSFYDEQQNWGINVDPGQIVEVRIGDSNSKYLEENLQPKITNKNSIQFNKVIFENGKYIDLDLLILHQKQARPKIKSYGKIAGLEEIAIVDATEKDSKTRVALRVISVIIFLIAAVAISLVLGYWIDGILLRQSRRLISKKFTVTTDRVAAFEILTSFRWSKSSRALRRAGAVLFNLELLTKVMNELPIRAEKLLIDELTKDKVYSASQASQTWELIQDLFVNNLIKRGANGKAEVDPSVTDFLVSVANLSALAPSQPKSSASSI